jgi:diguanylate cyclase
VNDRIWRWYLGGAVAAIAALQFLPEGGWAQVIAQILIGYAAAAAILVGLRRHRLEGAAAWYCFALGIAGNATGILVEAINTRIREVEEFPSVADIGYLTLYPALALGLALMIRRRTARTDWAALVDATTVTTGLGLLAWVFMIRPAAADPDIGLMGHLVSVSYPVGDIVLVAMTVRLQLGSGARTPAFRLMTGSLLAFLAGDTAWAVINQVGWEPGLVPHRFLMVIFLVAYLLFGAAALHPSARDVGAAAQPQPPRLSRGLLFALTGASLIGPLLLIQQATRREVTDGLAIAVGCVVLFLLVVTRMAQLLRALEQQTSKIRELSRTDELTGLPNRRAWNAELPRAIERARRDGTPLAVAMLDLDFFKRFNDAYGHPAGDQLLKSAAASWREQIRSVDHLGRYGGEEFIVLLPAADAELAFGVVERLRQATPLGQTVSCGLASWDGVETSDELVARADAALYAAKQGGRDRVAVAGQDKSEVPVAA